jgi:hypothetical protein
MPKHDHNTGHTCTATPNPENSPVTTSGQQSSPVNSMSNPYRNNTVQKLYRNSTETALKTSETATQNPETATQNPETA